MLASTADSADLRDRHEHADPRRASRHPAARVRLQPRPPAPRARLRRRAGARGNRGHLRRRARTPPCVSSTPSRPARSSCSAIPTSTPPADDVPKVTEHRPVGLEGIDRKLIEFMRRKGLHPDDVDLLPEGDALPPRGVRRRRPRPRPTRRPRGSIDATSRGDESGPTTKLFDDRWEEQKLWQVRESGLGATAHVPGHAAKPSRVGGRRGAARTRRRLPARLPRAPRRVRLRRRARTATSARVASTAASTSTSTPSHGRRASGASSSTGPPTSSSPTADRCPASTATARPAPSCCRRCTAKSWSARSRDFKDCWDPDGQDESRQGGATRTRSTRTSASGPSYDSAGPSTHFAFPDDGFDFANATPTLRRRRQVPRRRVGGTMCPSYMATREEEDSTRGRARMLFEMLRGDVSSTVGATTPSPMPSTCASRARAARPNAR